MNDWQLHPGVEALARKYAEHYMNTVMSAQAAASVGDVRARELAIVADVYRQIASDLGLDVVFKVVPHQEEENSDDAKPDDD